jgi:cytochrome P450
MRASFETVWVGLDIDRGLLRLMADNEVCRARIGLRRFVMFKNPDAIDHVLHKARLNYAKSIEYESVALVAGLNLLTDDGESWAAHRGALNPMFAKRHLNQIFDLMVDPVSDRIDACVAQGDRFEFDMQEEMVRTTLLVVANSLFSQDFGAVIDNMHDLATKGLRAVELLLRASLVGALPRSVWAILSKIAYSPVPVPPPFAVLRDVARGLDQAVNEVVDQRIANPTVKADLLNMLLRADGGSWPRQRVRDEALTFMLAGHETTANGLTWFWYLMALNTAARDLMLAEVDSVLGGGRRIAAQDLNDLPWTTACVQESQRYFSAVPAMVRTALNDDMVAGHHVRKGTTVMIPIHAIHHDERYWDRPEDFDPTRFMPGAPRPHRSAYLPFGGGRRACIGQSFALMEMVAIAAMLSQRFTYDLVPGHPVELSQSLTLRPKHGIRMVARRREQTVTDPPIRGPINAARCPEHTEDTTSQ